jgi:hypothetical protein
MQGYATGINNGFMCPNDVRRLENWDLIPEEEGGNLFMVNGTMTPLKMAGAAYKDGNVDQSQEPEEPPDEDEPENKRKPRRR